ncbi:hypothetical protein Kfla_5293 [Kribbella flavida DSM 17836]|uniref:Uncharacterized protein n=1 Tax=Kribbella flavida (strain DSM 17836 / JCM 10339 / NBRC 14399) TaxID=479435 RepID=D2PL52_KRIFD|nr:hypothetical protein [Kribbella flavida]ADB34307.1 hypothetical protein Kfla_5293 [Kribbella flavida DSM 17836]
MNENTTNQMIVTMLAEGQPVWFVAAMVNMRSHDVYLIGKAAGYPDPAKLRRAVWAQKNRTRAAA